MGVKFPVSAAIWLAPESSKRLLISGVGALNAARAILKTTNPELVCTLAPDRPKAQHFAKKLAPFDPIVLTAKAPKWPIMDASFDLVLFGPEIADLNQVELLASAGRCLRPGGLLAACAIVRDDSVPWVTRLATLVQEVSPTAMQTTSFDLSESLKATGGFTDIEHRSFGLWVPCGRQDLINLVHQATTTSDPGARAKLLDAVGELYDKKARPPEPLLLPYRVECWRAVATPTTAPERVDSAVSIKIVSPNSQPTP